MAITLTKADEILLDPERTSEDRQYAKYKKLSNDRNTKNKSIFFLRTCASRGHEQALLDLEQHEKGLLDDEKATSEIQFFMYKNYKTGNSFYGISPDPKKAHVFLEAACRDCRVDGDINAQFEMSFLLNKGSDIYNIKPNKKECIRHLEAAARLDTPKAGSKLAKYLMAHKFKEGDGVELSHKLYIKYLSHAAMRSNTSKKGLMKAKIELRQLITKGKCPALIIALPDIFIRNILDVDTNYILSDYKKDSIIKGLQNFRESYKKEQKVAPSSENTSLDKYRERYGDQGVLPMQSSVSRRAIRTPDGVKHRSIITPEVFSNFFGTDVVESKVRALAEKTPKLEVLSIA